MSALGGVRGRLAGWNAAEARLGARDGLGVGWQIAVFVLVALALVSRDPAQFLHAQFYAEDGYTWYADAYNGGWLHSLTLAAGGYLNTLQRIGGGLALLVPFRFAPLVMNVVGLLLQCLPVTVLLSARCRRWGLLTTRMLFAGLYVAAPHAREVHVVLTNSQWHLALVLPLLLFAAPPAGRTGRVLDVLLFALAGFCGPYGLVLVPLGLLFWLVRRQRWTLVQAGLMAIGAGVQVLVLMGTTGRPPAVLGASVVHFVRLLGGYVVMASMFGALPWALRVPLAVLAGFTVLGLLMYGYCLLRAGLELRLFVLYCLLLLFSALRHPLTVSAEPMWPIMESFPSLRYWLFPMLALLWGSAWCFMQAPSRMFRFLGGAAVLATTVGILQDWRYSSFPEMQFQQQAARFAAAPAGSVVEIREVPIGWKFELTKRR